MKYSDLQKSILDGNLKYYVFRLVFSISSLKEKLYTADPGEDQRFFFFFFWGGGSTCTHKKWTMTWNDDPTKPCSLCTMFWG